MLACFLFFERRKVVDMQLLVVVDVMVELKNKLNIEIVEHNNEVSRAVNGRWNSSNMLGSTDPDSRRRRRFQGRRRCGPGQI